MGRVIGIQTSVPAVTPTVAYELSPAPLGFSPGVPGEHHLGQSPTDDRALWKSRFQWRKKKIEFGCTGEDKRKSSSLPHITFPPGEHSSLPRHIFLKPRFLLRGQVKACEGAPSSPSCAECSQRILMSFNPSRVLSHELNDWWMGTGWKRGR